MPLLKARAEASGVVFEHAYSQAPWTLPSHTAMITGKYPWDLGVWEFLDAVPLEAETLAERLQAEGYATGLFSIGSFVQPQWQFDQGFEHVYGSPAVRDWNDLPALFTQTQAWIESTDGTYFAFIRPFEAHDPYRNGTDIHELVAINTAGTMDAHAERLISGYQADLPRIDAALDQLLNSLAPNTIVVITSDHGEEFGEHGTVGLHGTTVYNESIHVPLIVFAPGIPAARVPSSVETRSIPATIYELTGTSYARAQIAPSLVAHMLGETTKDLEVRAGTTMTREQLLATIESAYENVALIVSGVVAPRERTDPYTGAFTEGALLGAWKVLNTPNGREIYNVALDPTEQVNLAEVVRDLPLADQIQIQYLASLLP